MSTTTGPYALALGVTGDAPNPTLGGKDFTAVQLQNSSVFVLTVLADGLTYTLQPFVAQTIPLSGTGSPIQITPSQNPSGVIAGDTLTLVWLLAGESPPMQDGPLTAAAILAGLAGAGIAGAGLQDVVLVVASGAVGTISLVDAFQFWSWGWLATGMANVPTSGNASLNLQPHSGSGFSILDNVTYQEGASNRLAGAKFPPFTDAVFTNNFDFGVEFFLVFSQVS